MRGPLVRFENSLRNPFRLIDDFEREFGKILNNFPSKNYELKNSFGACDFEEKENHYLVTMDLPGIPKNEINIEATDGSLRVWGERKSERKEGDYSERYWGRFERTIPVPKGVDEKQIEARFENGVLSLRIPKTGEAKSKMIEIK